MFIKVTEDCPAKTPLKKKILSKKI